MGSRRRTTNNTTVNNTTVVNAPSAGVVNVVAGPVGQINTTVVNQTVIVNSPPPVILPPPAQRVITATGAISAPSVTTIGNTVIQSVAPDLAPVPRYSTPTNVWSNVPFVTVATPSATVTVTNNPNVDTSIQVSDARNIRTELCDSLTNNPAIAAQDWTITGNGGATNFRFPVRGAPSNVVVTNLSTGATVSSSTYTVVVRTDSFSWLRFDTAPADGISFKVTFEIGDSGVIRTVDANSWNDWQSLVKSLDARLNAIKNATTTTTAYIGANSVTTWNVGDPTLINDAQNAVVSLRRAIKRPGQRMDVGQVAGICDYLDKQLERIEGNLNKVGIVEGIRCGTNPPKPNTDSNVAGRIYQNDIRYTYFVGPSSCASYRPPNQPDMFGLAVCYSKKYDSATGRFYYSIG